MAKKSGGGGVGLVLLIGAVALLASIPKAVWITLAIVAAIGAAVYIFSQNKSKKEKPWSSTPLPSGAFSQASPVAEPRRTAVAEREASITQEPVSVYRDAPAPRSHKVPTPPAGYGAATWLPSGQPITIADTVIPGGLVYVGTSLRTPSGRPDPSLIDPSKKVAARGDYSDRNGMDYWPSYSDITPEARRAYLQWSAGGRQDPTADIGYVFLFFYGLERRVILDGSGEGEEAKAAQADRPAIAQEIRRLLSTYGSQSGSFQRYATDLLTVVELNTYSDKLYARPLPEFPDSYELPLYLRLALGQCAMANVPVPAPLALAWVRRDPNIYLRTPATRCAEQFEKLFHERYAALLNGGLVLPRNKTKLKFLYRAASAALVAHGEIKVTFGDTPDVTVLTGPVEKLQEVVDVTTSELDAYSRFLGRSPEAADALEGLLLLPLNLWPSDARQKLDALLARIADGMVTLQLQEVAACLGTAQRLERATVTSLARVFEGLHVGMEPDVLNGARTPKPEETLVLFSVPPGESVNRNSAPYQSAALTVQLAIAVASADGDFGAEEFKHLRQHIEGWTHLTAAHQQRLRAHMRYLMAVPPSLASLKKKLEPLAAPAKEALAKFMVTVAQADGTVSPTEIKMLEKVYKALGVDPQKVFGDVHAVAAAPTGTPSAQTVSPIAPKPAAAGFQLDAARIAALQHDTDKVSALLSNIFTEEPVEAQPPAPAAVAAPEPEEHLPEAPLGLRGLDAAHTAFVHQLLSRPQWTREELLDLASDLDLMLDGALERVNEAAFDAHDGPLTEGDDPITINRDLLESQPT
ncbi:MAG: TerB N-terminal domain-containing protein [Proteobacteria bacterium]|nr:TerB N-terminal domain-containing protein [Pseudomonadota bacterium]MBS0493698.1 TerB N-terminal domain-containing protein [Pseudomonadota bacterium]